MAIRDDFTAGEVLAAADLNDTFASKPPFAYGTATPSTTVEGFIWYDENDTPPTAKFWDGSAFENIAAPSGLVHINTNTFTTAGTVNVNDVFDSTYDYYRIFFDAVASTNNTITMRLRVSGSDSSTEYTFAGYFGYMNANFSGFTVNNGLAGTSWGFTKGGTVGAACVTDIVNPAKASATVAFHQSSGFDSQYVIEPRIQRHITTTAYDGFSIICSTGTITGNIRVYGYKNS